MEWFRMYAEFADDPKVQMLSEAMQRRFVMILCMRCSNKLETFHETEKDAAVAFQLRISEQEMRDTKELLFSKGLIDNDWNPVKWEGRQYASDSSTERVRRHRDARKHEKDGACNKVKRFCNALDTDTDTEKANTLSASADGTPDDHDHEGPHLARVIPAKAIVAAYHEHLPMLPQVRVLTETRKRKLKARWTEDPGRQSVEYWADFFAFVAKSDFLTGRSGAWTSCDFEWLIEASNHVKVIEGKYENREAA